LKKNYVVSSALIFGLAATAAGHAADTVPAPLPSKIGIVNVMAAILATKDGQRITADQEAKLQPLKAKQREIEALRDQLREGAATMSADAKARIEREIQTIGRSMAPGCGDTEVDMRPQAIWAKMKPLVEKYGAQNGYTLILDSSNQGRSVPYAAPAVTITSDIVRLYDQAYPAPAASSVKNNQ
jgi:Skp family chaperone for outer membrane proteins